MNLGHGGLSGLMSQLDIDDETARKAHTAGLLSPRAQQQSHEQQPQKVASSVSARAAVASAAATAPPRSTGQMGSSGLAKPAPGAASAVSGGLFAALDWYDDSRDDHDSGGAPLVAGGEVDDAAAADADDVQHASPADWIRSAAAQAPAPSPTSHHHAAHATAAVGRVAGRDPPRGADEDEDDDDLQAESSPLHPSFGSRARQLASDVVHKLGDALHYLMSAPVEKWVSKAASDEDSPLKWKYGRRLVVFAWDAATAIDAGLSPKDTDLRLAEALHRRPLRTSPLVAAKVALLLLRLLQEGPPRTVDDMYAF